MRMKQFQQKNKTETTSSEDMKDLIATLQAEIASLKEKNANPYCY